MRTPSPSCAVAVCTYNGSRFLREQLDSITNQSLRPSEILVSDDGSSDNTLAVAERFSKEWTAGDTRILNGPGRGYAVNFLASLARIAPETDLVALSDQDDVWTPTKLNRAHKMLEPLGDMPALYGGATWICDEGLKVTSKSRPLRVALGFRHAIGQNFAGGNTMVLNNAGLRLVQKAWALSQNSVPVHDWWLYQLVSGAGGRVVYDREPCLFYRQHKTNQIGDAAGLLAMGKRMRRMVRGDYRNWNTANLKALSACYPLLSQDNKAVLETVLAQRNGGMAQRLALMRSPGLYRQGTLGQAGLMAALALNRF
ncbi:glycosyltransferase involved in cell wall biosynthesis [Litoreibacter halocynthiae]|uniref:Glycosyltransferase involved in cell wall biosynthesis n=1 Tax=Litoreibacter halocynthiae TaxID=1242689 RepID=A0A4R7LC78_9RHOB|nr:glycosyltransferase family 2 protein [Litoreibacter halocynthiae]TDT73143.1 glycosyltransferase involved in cell wall biosynthesis [Litoreibacter halocynthiae]